MMLVTLVSIGLVAAALAALPLSVQASSIALSNFAVTPALAPGGTSVTGSVTVQNLDVRNSVTVVVTFYDGGVAAASNSASPSTLAKGKSLTIQLDFVTIGSAPHCYAVQATPGPESAGHCEPGGYVLGGTAVSAFNPMIVLVAVASASLAAGGLLLALRRQIRRQ